MKKALVVGIDIYPYSRLYGCVNDAMAVAGLLERHSDSSVNFDVRLEKNITTKAKLKSLIYHLFDCDHDTCLFYYSGHGYMNIYGSGYIVTPDMKEYDEGVSMDEILHIANCSKAKNKIIILDCCHSGVLGSPGFAGGSLCQIGEGVTIMTASRRDEKAKEYDGHGVFTGLLIDALEGGASDISGAVTPASIYAYIDRSLGAWEQRPVFKTNITRFMSVRNVRPDVSLDVLKTITTYFDDPRQEHVLDPSYEYTNSPDVEHKIVEPYAVDKHVKIFKDLQQLHSIGLVQPVGEEHMYWAAMNNKSCKLTPLGEHYWRLVNDSRI